MLPYPMRGLWQRTHAVAGYPSGYRRSAQPLRQPLAPAKEVSSANEEVHIVRHRTDHPRHDHPYTSPWSDVSSSSTQSLPTEMPPTETPRQPAPKLTDNVPVYEDYEQRHTLSALYLPKQHQQEFVQIDHTHKRKQRDLEEIAQAAKRLGMDAATVTSNLQQLQRLLPTLTPDLFKMNATHWARILHNVPHTAATLITFKSLYPGVDAGVVFKTNPKLLLKDSAQLEQDASQVYHILKSLAPEQRDAVLEAVPCLTDPVQLVQALGFLQHTFPNQNPLDILCADPTKVVNIEEADLEAEPLYGRSFW